MFVITIAEHGAYNSGNFHQIFEREFVLLGLFEIESGTKQRKVNRSG